MKAFGLLILGVAFKNNATPTLIDAKHAIAHNKVMILDECVVITGSFNFTRAAEENNAENLLVINDRVLAARFADNWHVHEPHSEPYERPAKEQRRPGARNGTETGHGAALGA